MALSRSRRHLGVFRLVPLFLLLVSTMVAAQNTPVESTVLLVTTELNTATAGNTVKIVTIVSTAATTTKAIKPTQSTLATVTTSTSPTSLIPTNTAQTSTPNKGPPKVVIIVASLGGAGVLAAVCMGLYFCCCRSARKKRKTKPIVSQEFFAPTAMPMREPRLPVLPPTPVSRTPPKEQQLGRIDAPRTGSRWPLADSRGASSAPAPAPAPWNAGRGGYRGNRAEYKGDSYRGSPPPPPAVYKGGYNRGGPPQGYGEGVGYGDPVLGYRSPELHMWDNREDRTGRIAELPPTTRRVPSGSGRGMTTAEVHGTSRVPRATAELPS